MKFVARLRPDCLSRPEIQSVRHQCDEQWQTSFIWRVIFAIPKATLTGFPSTISGTFLRSIWVKFDATLRLSFAVDEYADFGVSWSVERLSMVPWEELQGVNMHECGNNRTVRLRTCWYNASYKHLSIWSLGDFLRDPHVDLMQN